MPLQLIITAANTRVTRQRCGLRAAGDHQRHDQAHLDDRYGDRQQERPERLTDAMGNHFGVIDRGEDGCRECKCHKNFDEGADVAPPGQRQQDHGQDGNDYRPGEDLQPRTCCHGARLP